MQVLENLQSNDGNATSKYFTALETLLYKETRAKYSFKRVENLLYIMKAVCTVCSEKGTSFQL